MPCSDLLGHKARSNGVCMQPYVIRSGAVLFESLPSRLQRYQESRRIEATIAAGRKVQKARSNRSASFPATIRGNRTASHFHCISAVAANYSGVFIETPY